MHDKIEFLFVLRSFLETSGIRSMIKNRRRVNKNNWWAFDKHDRSADQMCKLGKWWTPDTALQLVPLSEVNNAH